jgi:hypothetical protein
VVTGDLVKGSTAGSCWDWDGVAAC